ncbi:unnamed protein product [Brachionus calyciflorus]|uniref:Uncharacterized protein n=1 Tax=Brachionus calyciflorus TaxID=104777 RepID=A0A813XBJ7_9BILA|nr:unnamed protein product [Brachionus calyciflorus]
MFGNGQEEFEEETKEEVYTNSKMITEMMNEIAQQVDTLEDRIVVYDKNIDELNEFVIDHEENIQENKKN